MNGVTADKGSHAWVSFIGQFVITVKATVPLTTQRFRMVFTSAELYEMEPEERHRIVNGTYDVACTTCKGSGKIKVPIISALTFGEKKSSCRRTPRTS